MKRHPFEVMSRGSPQLASVVEQSACSGGHDLDALRELLNLGRDRSKIELDMLERSPLDERAARIIGRRFAFGGHGASMRSRCTERAPKTKTGRLLRTGR